MQTNDNSTYQPIIVVSGLPRSGTSLMMQLLEAAGVPLLVDQLRDADQHNPRGYYEYEPAKSLMKDSSWVSLAQGKGVKVILQLLPFLPQQFPLSVIIMQRPMSEILDSQQRMLANSGKSNQEDTEVLAQVFDRQIASVIEFLQRRPSTRWIEVSHAKLIAGETPEIRRITDFLQLDSECHLNMLSRIDPILHRSRG